MANVFLDAISETRRRLAGELRAAAATGNGRGLRGLLLSSAAELEGLRTPSTTTRAIFLVRGEEISDGTGSSWIVGAYGSQKSADRLVAELTEMAQTFGRSVGNADLVGLELARRRELETHLKRIDPDAKVGRHGVRWYAEQTKFRSE